MYRTFLDTPIGTICISSDGTVVNAISFGQADEDENSCAVVQVAKDQLKEYFEGKRNEFDFDYAQPGTPFQQNVWYELRQIKAGAPISYLALSKRMNQPLAIRAIAAANGRNKLMIVVPCHRVIGSKGDLVGYAGELWRKKWLLEHEARMTNTGQSALFL